MAAPTEPFDAEKAAQDTIAACLRLCRQDCDHLTGGKLCGCYADALRAAYEAGRKETAEEAAQYVTEQKWDSDYGDEIRKLASKEPGA